MKTYCKFSIPIFGRAFTEWGSSLSLQIPTRCNLSLVLKFYANLTPVDEPDAVVVRGMEIQFTTELLYKHLRTPIVPSGPLTKMYEHLIYHAIRDTLYGVTTAQWVRVKDTRTHKTLDITFFTKEARIWLKIVYSRLMPFEHTMMRERVCFVHMLMTG